MANLNDTLKIKEVTKAKVWPRPNYEQLVADGMPAILARMVKQVYDGISAGPTIRTDAVTDEQLQRYIDTLAKIREGLFNFVNDKQAVGEFASSVLALSNGNRSMAGPISIIDMMKTDVDAKAVSEVLLRRVWPEEYQGNMRPFVRGTRANNEVAIIGGNKALAALQFVRQDFAKWGADLTKGWPGKREAWEVQGYRVLAPGEYTAIGREQQDGSTRMTIRRNEGRGSWTATFTVEQLANAPFVLVQDGGFGAQTFETREAAIEAAREKVKRKSGAGQDIRGTNIEAAERSGPARREEGEDITSQRLMDAFGFRGVNFGREGWINQAERQAYLNQAYDGLMDLAEILDVPPKAMSLDGELGIAFGAQGKGKFAAHFVPGVNEINLTKTKGAGTLAHEWGHALDHWFAKQAGLAKDKEPFLSEHAYKPDTGDRMEFEGGKYVRKTGVPTFGQDIRPQIVQAFRTIYQSMEKRDASPEETQANTEAVKASALKRLNSWIAAARRPIESSQAENKDDLLAEFDQHAEKLREGDTGDGYEKAGKQSYSARVAAVRNLIKDATGRVWSADETMGLESNASFVRSLMAKQDADRKHEPQKVSTQYKRDSAAMDKEKGGKAYWSTPTEMFARAFELYVHDKLVERGALNTFLTDAQQRSEKPVQVDDTSSAMARASGAKRDLYLYPTGQERATLRDAFDKLVDAIETRETDKGVMLYEPDAEYNAEAPRRPYTDDRQLQLFLDNGPVESQAGPRGVAAQRQAVSAVDDLRSTGSILAQALSGDYAARQRVSLVGQKVSSAEDLAVLAQVYRDPRFETFRVVFVNDAGNVVSQVGLTSRLPTSVNAIMGNDVDAYLSDISATARNRGATRYYLLHNHPSGIATPSRADVFLTTTFASKMPMLVLQEHVVIDTNEYSTIDGVGGVKTLKKDFGQPAPYRAQEWADVKITSPADVMAMAKRLQVDEDAVTLIHTDSQFNVKAISTIPTEATIGDQQQVRRQVVKASLRVQGSQVFAVSRNSAALLRIKGLIRDGIHVSESGQVRSLANEGLVGGSSPFPESRRTRLSPDTSPEFAYLRQGAQPAPMQRAAEEVPEYGAQQPNPNRDALGRLKFRLGEVALHKLDAATRPLQERFGMRMASPELRRQLRQMKATIEEAKRKAVDVAKEMSAMPEADRAMVSDIVEKMIAPGVVPPEHAVKVADAITRTMDQQTDELVALGMLSPESAERWRGRYLPRIYNRQTELQDDPLIKRLFKTGTPTMQGIGGGSLKGRGLFQDVSIDSVDQWLAMGYEVRDPHWKMNQGKLELVDKNAPQVAREQVTVWRDWTPSERAQMGENRDALYRFVQGYTAMQRDIALGRLFNDIANNPEWVRRSGSEGWVQVPNTEIPDTGGVKRYGNLAGLYVRKDVMSHLTQFEEAANDTLQLYREALGLWKEGKTALNPVAHFNNVMSNVSMAHFAGVSYWDGQKYAAAVRDLVNDAPMVDEARKVGLFTGSFTKEEMVQAMPPELQKLMDMEEGKARKAGKQVMNAMTFWLRKPLRDAYEFEDSFFKYLIYRDARQQGMSPEAATDYALRYIFTYDDLPSGARKVRDFAIPFFSWTYKAAPALLHTAMVYPWRFLAPAAVLNGINLVAYALAAGDEDDNWLEKIAKGRELEKEEREALPERTAGTGLLLNPKTIRLGTDSVTGNPVFLDASRVVPGGDMFDMVNQAGGIALPAPLMPNHPVLSAFSAMIANKEMFFGRDIVDRNDTGLEAAEKRAKWMAGFLLPAVAPGGYHSQRIADAAANAMDTVITVPGLGEFTGVDRSGLPVQPKYAAMQTLGIKARPTDLELEAQRKRAQEAALINSIAAEVRSMARLYQRGAVSDEMMERTREKAREKIERVREGEKP